MLKRLSLENDIRPLSEFRANATAFLQQVHDTRRPLIITHHGKSAAVLIDVAEFEKLLETMEVLQEINEAEIQSKENKGLSHGSAKKEILKRLK